MRYGRGTKFQSRCSRALRASTCELAPKGWRAPGVEIIEPDVLNKDREKWARTHDPAIVERAVRRGKQGWLVGAKLEVMPHVLVGAKLEVMPHVPRSHMALRWTGPGGKVPKIVPVKWSVVHRENAAGRDSKTWASGDRH